MSNYPLNWCYLGRFKLMSKTESWYALLKPFAAAPVHLWGSAFVQHFPVCVVVHTAGGSLPSSPRGHHSVCAAGKRGERMWVFRPARNHRFAVPRRGSRPSPTRLLQLIAVNFLTDSQSSKLVFFFILEYLDITSAA